jgi:asparagine synthase (glutamine-hydrolysing)
LPDLELYTELHAAWFETNLYMQNQLLRDTDVMSMSHGLEVRVPFVDEDFQQLAENIAPGIRFDSKQPKKLLIDSFAGLLPEEIWKRPKMGFTFPLSEWMKAHRDIGNVAFYDGKLPRQAIQKFNEGKMHWSKAFALYQIQLNG